ncbi:translation initiation factor IF-2 [Macaca thibetana thibetana]|uniref:translation initiation factor IF-2 n=1 Tax=Macaca thibetana thibetana TaxID=257877 RepID=UPI0021BCB3D2|nr:translation initiation factor IF-2 [Macaca thibetana thibetana]
MEIHFKLQKISSYELKCACVFDGVEDTKTLQESESQSALRPCHLPSLPLGSGGPHSRPRHRGAPRPPRRPRAARGRAGAALRVPPDRFPSPGPPATHGFSLGGGPGAQRRRAGRRGGGAARRCGGPARPPGPRARRRCPRRSATGRPAAPAGSPGGLLWAEVRTRSFVPPPCHPPMAQLLAMVRGKRGGGRRKACSELDLWWKGITHAGLDYGNDN